MNRKTLFSTFLVMSLAAGGVVSFLSNVRSDDEKPQAAPRVSQLVLDRVTVESPKESDLPALRAEIRALREDMRIVLSLLKQKKVAATAEQDNARIVEISDHTKIFGLEFVQAENVANAIENMVPDARVSVLYEENRLVVAAKQRSMQHVADAIKTIDRPRKQVHINSYIYEIPVAQLVGLGLAPDDDSAGAIRALLSRSHRLKTIAQLSQTEGVRLLARPNIRAYDRTTATFESVTEIPVQTLTQTSAGGNIGTTEFREAGIRLEVTPTITARGTIIMEVRPEYSKLSGFVEGQPIIDRRSATTTVLVKDGAPIVISGLRSQQRQVAKEVPDGPNTQDTELLIILSAEIIDDGEEE